MLWYEIRAHTDSQNTRGMKSMLKEIQLYVDVCMKYISDCRRDVSDYVV